MTHKKFGVRPFEWAKHLRKALGMKRRQEKRVRGKAKEDIGSIVRGYSRDRS